MSQGFEIQLLLAATRALYQFGRQMGGAAEGETGHTRHLLRRETQIADRDLLRQTLDALDLMYREGDPSDAWGGGIDLSVTDAEGEPWFALAWDEEAQAYVILSRDPKEADGDVDPAYRLSERDPMPILGRVAQHYGYLKTLRGLLQDGFEAQGSAERQSDGSQALLLRREDPESGEEHTVRLIFRPRAGGATILTDSRKPDGKHGICPDVDSILQSAGIHRYEKWTAPVAEKRSAGRAAGSADRADVPPEQAARDGRGSR
jgi:hypothetical protein